MENFDSEVGYAAIIIGETRIFLAGVPFFRKDDTPMIEYYVFCALYSTLC